ncbi:MAG: hypothetical protein HYZ25_14140 [Chloroflexi bacterium]|nr:hypothetical protein [Chloroflexota bacterium]
MTSTIFSWLAVGILLLAVPTLTVVRDWRWMLGLLAAIYLAVFLLVLQHWPLAMSVVKLVTGWMGTAALGMTLLNRSLDEDGRRSFFVEGSPFRLFGAGMVILLVVSATPRIEAVIPGIGQSVLVGGLALVGVGLFHLGMTSDVLRVVIVLLIILAGFEILYAAVETSILVAALLSAVTLGLALTGSYLILQSNPEVEEEEGLL